MFGIRDGGDIEDIESTENITLVVPVPLGILITFRVHGSEGLRTYLYRITLEELAEVAPEIAGLIAL